jgi:ABC-2 type transport system permease protein
MNADIWTVVWKEFREMLRGPGARFNTAVMIGTIGLMGVLLPLQLGASFATSPVALLACLSIPMIVVPATVADSFAGERERHTLETLLAGRLSDRAILLGKVWSPVLYAWVLTIIGLLVGLISLNLKVAAGGRLLLFPAWLALSLVTVSFLACWLFAAAGVLISLRSPTVQKAQQMLGAMTVLPIMPLIVLILVLGDARFGALLTTVISRMPSDFRPLVAVGALVMLLIDLALVWISLARFQRARLILD